MTADTGSEPRRQPPTPCPVCGKLAAEAFSPFCSQRCADADLGRWLGERYVIPGPELEPGEDHDDTGSN